MLFRRTLIIAAALLSMHNGMAAEWSATPGLRISSIYNDNVGLRPGNDESSTGYTVAPRLKLSAQEPNWDVRMNALVKATRYNDAEDADSDNYFFTLENGYSTERHAFQLDASFSRNTTFDNDYDTELPSAGLIDELTERESTTITPSWQWATSESSSFSIILSTSDIEYDEVSSTAYKDYQIDTATIKNIWNVGPRSQLGFTLSYSQYEDEKETVTVITQDFTQYLEYEKSVYQLDYIYKPSETSQLNLSVGRRNLDTTRYNWPVSCSLANPFTGECIVPVFDDVEESDDGTEVTADYSHSNEVSSINIGMSRMVIPSSFGGAQEEERASIRYTRNLSERLGFEIILDTRQTRTIEGDSRDDRERYRFEPSVNWVVRKHWSLSMSYRYIEQTLTTTDTDSESNGIYLNLYMSWPRLASSY